MSDYIDNIFGGLKTLENNRIDLSELIQGFETVGNEYVANRLIDIVESISRAEGRIQKAVADELNRRPGGKL